MNNEVINAVKSWINALNNSDVDALILASRPDIAIVGPMGTAYGVDVLRNWYTQTRLTFDLEKLLVNGNQAIVVGTAHWHDANGAETGTAPTAFLLGVTANMVATLSRHDEGLDAAMAASGKPEPSQWAPVN